MGGTHGACRGEGSQPVVRTKGQPPRMPGPSPRAAAAGEVVFLWHREAREDGPEGWKDDVRKAGVNEERALIPK